MRGQFIARPEDSRYGSIQFILKDSSFLVVQEDGAETIESCNPMMDVKNLFESQIRHKEKKRVYCNKALREQIDNSFLLFTIPDFEHVYFHNNPKQWASSGMILRSGKSMELSFNMPHSFMKKNQVQRKSLVFLRKYDDHILFRCVYTENVTWKTRNKRFDKPVITIG